MIDRLRHVQIETVAGCNARCTMCPVPTMQRAKGRMGETLFRSIVDQAVDFGVGQIVPFLNGEPLLDRAIMERLEYITARGASTHLTTNAALLTAARVERLEQIALSHLTISFVGGTKAAYERVMGLDFDRVVENTAYAVRRLPYPVRVYMTEFEDNAGTVEAFKRRWGAHAWIGKYSNWAGKRPSAMATGGKPRPCGRVLERMTVLWDGRVSLCCLDSEGDVILGDLARQRLTDVWNDQQKRRDRHRVLDFDMPLCRDCNWNWN
jgi:radical SAM protein with 4Fe4S-binding SPASM domain